MNKPLLLLLTLFSFGFADPMQKNNSTYNGEFEIGGSVLLWKPTTKSILIAESFAGPPNGIVHQVVFKNKYDWGFQVFLNFYLPNCCDYIGAGWTHINTNERQVDIAPANLNYVIYVRTQNSQVTAGQIADTKLKFRYDKIAFVYGRITGAFCNTKGYFYSRWAYLHLKKDIYRQALDANSNFLSFEQMTSKTTGGMGEIGWRGMHRFGKSGFHLAATFGMIAAVATARLDRMGATNTPTTVVETYDSQTICFPGIHWKTALNYIFWFSSSQLMFEAGYMMDYYFNAIRTLTATFNSRNFDTVNIGFGGPFLMASYRF